MISRAKVAVIGAGISGLYVAYWIKEAGFDVDVYEATDRAGGCIDSELIDGFRVEWGPNTALETSAILRESLSALGLAVDCQYGSAQAAKRYIVRNQRLHALPTSPLAFIRSQLFSWTGKFRLFLEPLISKNSEQDPTLANFVQRRLGPEFLRYAINPFVAGVSGGVPEKLSVRSAFPKLWALEERYGSLVKGAILGARARRKSKEVAKDKARMFSFNQGLSQWSDTLAQRLGASIKLSTPIIRLLQRSDSFVLLDSKNRKHAYSQVVSALPAEALSQLLGTLCPDHAQVISKITYAPIAVVAVGYHCSQVGIPLDGFGFLTPAIEGHQILGSIWSSVIFPQKAPDGQVLMTIFVGGERQGDLVSLPDHELRQRVLKDLEQLMKITGEPSFYRVRRWPKAIPQYEVGYMHTQRRFEEIERQLPGFHIAGNIRQGISLGDSVLCAKRIAQAVILRLNQDK